MYFAIWKFAEAAAQKHVVTLLIMSSIYFIFVIKENINPCTLISVFYEAWVAKSVQ